MRRNGLTNGEESIEKWRFPRIRDVLYYIIYIKYLRQSTDRPDSKS